jgi:hypothetical protein
VGIAKYAITLVTAFVISLPMLSPMLANAKEKVRHLSVEERTELNSHFGQLAAFSNEGLWDDYVALLFIGTVEESAKQRVEHHRRRFPKGLRPRITSIEITGEYFHPERGYPADWTIKIAVTFLRDDDSRLMCHGSVYASQRGGRWLCTEPTLDQCDGSTSIGPGFPWY